MNIVVADDLAGIRKQVKRMLDRAGFNKVTLCEDGDTAYKALKDVSEPTIAILDWNMPGYTGIDICRMLKSEPTFTPLYILMLSSVEDREKIAEILEAGADDYLMKPPHESEFIARLHVGVRTLQMQMEVSAQAEQMRELIRKHNLLYEIGHGSFDLEGIDGREPIYARYDGEGADESLTLNKALSLGSISGFDYLVTSVFERMGQEIDVIKPVKPPAPIEGANLTAWTSVIIEEMKLWVDVVLETQNATASKLAHNALGAHNMRQEKVADFMSEAVTLIGSMLTQHLGTHDISCATPFVPQALISKGMDYYLEDLGPTPDRLSWSFEFNGEPITAHVLINEMPTEKRLHTNLRSMEVLADDIKPVGDESDVILIHKWEPLKTSYIHYIRRWVTLDTIDKHIPVVKASPIALKLHYAGVWRDQLDGE